jgi:hypothetical protein
MKPITQTFCLGVALTFANLLAHGETTNTPLSFYTVTPEKIEGGKFIDTAQLPKFGYIASKPELIITQIEKLSTASPGDWLNVWLFPEDSKRLQAFKGKRLVVMVGERVVHVVDPLFPITGNLLQFGFDNATELKKAQDELSKLVKGG